LALDLANGYLPASFLSPLSNRREDAWGGDLGGRMRLSLEVFQAVRSAWPADKPLAVYVSADDCVEGGAGIHDAIALARALREAGCDLLVVTAGGISERSTPNYSFDIFAQYCDVLRNESGLPAMSTAYMTTSNQVNTLLAGGRADLCMFHPRRRTSS
jgi:anthraniloyl-CoA monooxygenase